MANEQDFMTSLVIGKVIELIALLIILIIMSLAARR